MKSLLYAAVLVLSYYSVQGRSYGYEKKKLKPVPVPIPDNKIPHCNVGCTRQWIRPECREETYGFENGVKCKGCDRDICRGLDFTGVGNIGVDLFQNGRNWQDGGNRENRGIFNRRRNGGFVDSFQNLDLPGLGQRSTFNNRINGGNDWDVTQNRQFGNQW